MKEMLYLMTHSTHFIYGYMASNIWKRTIQIARENMLPHGLFFLISSKGSFICTIPQIGQHIPVIEHCLEQEIARGSTMKDRSDNPSHYEPTLLPMSYISVLLTWELPWTTLSVPYPG